jgi:hypothetical protein
VTAWARRSRVAPNDDKHSIRIAIRIIR